MLPSYKYKILGFDGIYKESIGLNLVEDMKHYLKSIILFPQDVFLMAISDRVDKNIRWHLIRVAEGKRNKSCPIEYNVETDMFKTIFRKIKNKKLDM